VDALAAGALGHVLRAPVRLAGPAVRRRNLVEALLRRVSNLLTMARRMRGATPGPAAVRAALEEGRAKLVLVARDAPRDVAASWTARAASIAVGTGPDAASLGALFGRERVEVVAITADGLAEALRGATERWRAFSVILCDNEKISKDQDLRGGAAAGGG
jgi:ribosomal protein L7Ae-like RNA K-turn-binding protein